MIPLVSVIIPNFNHAPYLRQRIRSVLEQSLTDLEVILLDDCSTDSSRSIIKEYCINPRVAHVILNEHNSGSPFVQWQKGLQVACGKYVWIAESDDYSDTNFLTTLVDALERHPAASFAFCGSQMVNAEGCPISMDWDKYTPSMETEEVYEGHEFIAKRMLWKDSVYNASMVVFRHNKGCKIPGEALSFRYCGDWFFWLLRAVEGQVVEVRRKLNYFRQHENKVSPYAERDGLYFVEGLRVINHAADILQLTPYQRRVVAGRTWKRFGLNRYLTPENRMKMEAALEQLSPGSSQKRVLLTILYEVDKYLNLSHLQQ